MIYRPRDDRNMTFHTWLTNHGYAEKPFDYVLAEIDKDIAARWPMRVAGPLRREALEHIWGSFESASMKRAYEIQRAMEPAPVAETETPERLPENGYQPEPEDDQW